MRLRRLEEEARALQAEIEQEMRTIQQLEGLVAAPTVTMPPSVSAVHDVGQLRSELPTPVVDPRLLTGMSDTPVPPPDEYVTVIDDDDGNDESSRQLEELERRLKEEKELLARQQELLAEEAAKEEQARIEKQKLAKEEQARLEREEKQKREE